MKAVEFKDQACQRVYDDYIKRCKRVVNILSHADQEETLMEVNSYIHEYMREHHDDELTSLLNILERLGDPQITLKEVVAEKKADQAVSTFNVRHLIQALILNVRNGFAYVILSVMTLFLLVFPLLAVLELLYPDETGLWVGDGVFMFGMTSDPNTNELLGSLFIPTVMLLGGLFYFVIILLLKIIKK